ncbi:DUF418 domain-containing protein [Amycolatopsis suaedae]|uniref:DUF418 domain-containing protein n=2 Tax=Amycolatopsis suaedae TaxID=2510978 RepID=A0A4V2ELV4_9PSEU|nr:DUF418 domain-containing protein [Amycolatopsis suaedae]
MYATHVGPDPADGGAASVFRLFEGRSAALFAVLAGVSVALMSGGREPKAGGGRRRVALRLAARAPLLVVLGLFLTSLETGYLVILAYYGACFVLVIPFLGLRVRSLVVAAVVGALAMPLISYGLRVQLAPRDLVLLMPDATPETFAGSGLGYILLVLLVSGTFPALGLMTYLFAGMAIGRLDLGSPVVCRRLVIGGAVLAAVAYTASWVATDVLGGMRTIYAAAAPAAAAAGMPPEEFVQLHMYNIHGTPPTTTPAWLLVDVPHSYTPFDFVACIGVAAAVIGGCQLLAARFPVAVRPLADLGGVILTAYAAHFVAIWLLFGDEETSPFSLAHFLWFGGVALVAAMLWKRWIGRGPLEWLLHVVSRLPERLLSAAAMPVRRLAAAARSPR